MKNRGILYAEKKECQDCLVFKVKLKYHKYLRGNSVISWSMLYNVSNTQHIVTQYFIKSMRTKKKSTPKTLTLRGGFLPCLLCDDCVKKWGNYTTALPDKLHKTETIVMRGLSKEGPIFGERFLHVIIRLLSHLHTIQTRNFEVMKQDDIFGCWKDIDIFPLKEILYVWKYQNLCLIVKSSSIFCEIFN